MYFNLKFLLFVDFLKIKSDDDDDDESESLSHEGVLEVWGRVLLFAIPYRRYMVGALLIAALASLCDLMQPIVLGMAINATTESMDGTENSSAPVGLHSLFLIMIILQIFKSFTEYGRERINNNLGDFARARAQNQFFTKVMHQERAFFDQNHTSDLNKRYHDLEHIHYFAGHQIPLIAKSALSITCMSAVMIYQNVTIGTIVISFIMVQAMIEKVLDKYVFEAWLKLRKVEKKADQCREESMANIKTVKHFSCEDKQTIAFQSILDQDDKFRRRLVQIWATRRGTGDFLMGIVVCGLWIIGLQQVKRCH